MYQYQRLRDMREDRDKTQRHIADLLHTTQQQYAKYEQGIQEIPVHHLIKLADYYGVSTDYLLGRISTEEEFARHK
ncbi:helix-turn-helix domain-containing protein [Gemmiger sp.]